MDLVKKLVEEYLNNPTEPPKVWVKKLPLTEEAKKRFVDLAILESVKKPQQIENVNLTALRKVCQEVLDSEYQDDDEDHWVYETAMETIFGTDVWEYLNKRRG